MEWSRRTPAIWRFTQLLVDRWGKKHPKPETGWNGWHTMPGPVYLVHIHRGTEPYLLVQHLSLLCCSGTYPY